MKPLRMLGFAAVVLCCRQRCQRSIAVDTL